MIEFGDSDLQYYNLKMEFEMVGLYQSLENSLAGKSQKIIPFTGCREGEGTSTIIQEFAAIAAMKFNRTVLLLDGSLSEYNQHDMFDVDTYLTIEDSLEEETSIYDAFYQVDETTLFMGKIFEGEELHPSFLTRQGIDSFLKKLGNKFDFILIDVPPSTSFLFNLATSKLINGVIVVVEAEKTRWPVVQNIKERITQNNGTVLGIVFNKRKYHIPNFLYRRL